MVKRHSRERRDSDAPSKTPKSNKSESEQSTKPVKNLKSEEEKRKKKSQQSNLFGPNRDLNSNANSKSNEPPRKSFGHDLEEDQSRGSLHVHGLQNYT